MHRKTAVAILNGVVVAVCYFSIPGKWDKPAVYSRQIVESKAEILAMTLLTKFPGSSHRDREKPPHIVNYIGYTEWIPRLLRKGESHDFANLARRPERGGPDR